MRVETMLSNAAVASQNRALIDDEVTRGAVLRSMRQWVMANAGADAVRLCLLLEQHPDYQR